MRETTPFGRGPRYLLRDNDRKYGQHVWAVTGGAGIEVLKTPLGALARTRFVNDSSVLSAVNASITC